MLSIKKKSDDAPESRASNLCRLFIGNLHSSVTEGDLIKICRSKSSELLTVTFLWHRSGPLRGKPKGKVIIIFQ